MRGNAADPPVETQASKAGGPERPWAGQPGVYLYPGDLYAASEPCAVTTILGTCVAVCLWDGEAGAGGMCHYLLPFHIGAGPASPRFGAFAVGELLRQVERRGARRARLRAKVFGGMQSRMTFPRDLGTRNAELAIERLREADIPIVARDVGGERGRKVIFQVHDGAAWVKQL